MHSIPQTLKINKWLHTQVIYETQSNDTVWLIKVLWSPWTGRGEKRKQFVWMSVGLHDLELLGPDLPPLLFTIKKLLLYKCSSDQIKTQ